MYPEKSSKLHIECPNLITKTKKKLFSVGFLYDNNKTIAIFSQPKLKAIHNTQIMFTMICRYNSKDTNR